MLALIDRLRVLEARARAASAAAKERFHKRGQLLPRERVALLLDPDAPFLELSTLAGFGFDVADAERSVPGGGLIVGIGFVSGTRCLVSANDAGIDAGALQPMGLDKALRAQEIALENKLPYVQLVESAGANLLRYRVEDFVRGGALFRNLARLSAAGLPVVTVTHGSSTAGGAYQTGLSDYIVMVRGRTRAFLAGPPLLKAATGEIADEEELGGAEMHTRVSGLGDYLAEDDRDALRIAREIVAGLGWDRPGEPRDASPAALRRRGAARHHADRLQAPGRHAPGDRAHRRRLRLPRIRARITARRRSADAPRSRAMAIGIVTNNGPLDPDGANKATHFIQACCQTRTPLLYLNNTTGYIVGRAAEQGGMIKHGSKMIQAVASATVPQITLYCGASFGAGNYGMCGRGFHPRFCFSWPNAKTAVMGAEQAAETMAIVAEAAAARRGAALDKDRRDKMKAEISAVFDAQMRRLRHQRAPARRRHHRPARHARRARADAGDLPRGGTARAAAHAVLGGAAMSAAEAKKLTPFRQDPRRQSRRDRAAHHADRAAARLRRRRGPFGRRRRRAACARGGRSDRHRRSGAGAILSQHRRDPRRRRRRAAPTRSIPATASSPRTPPSPRPARRPGSSSSARRPPRSAPWATRRAPRR